MLIQKREIYQGKIIQLNLEQLKLPNGQDCELEMIHHPGGAAVVALDHQQQVCLLRQYRHAANGWLWELPAGKLEDKEPPLDTASRELAEEAGVIANQWQYLGKMHSSPGVFTEIISLYLATELKLVPQQPEQHEVLEVHWMPFDQALSWAITGNISDAKTLLGLFWAATAIGRWS